MAGFSLFRVGRIWHYRFQRGGARIQRSTRQTVRVKAEEIAWSAFAGEPAALTLSELAERWLAAHAATASPAYLRSVEIFARRHVYQLGAMRIARISTPDVELARAHHLDGRSPATGNHWLRIAKRLFNWAVECGLLSSVSWKLKALRLQKRPRPVLPVAKGAQWLGTFDNVARARPAIHLAVRLMLGLGLRESEARTARWEWIDWERNLYTPGITKGREADAVPMPQWVRRALWAGRKIRGLICPSPRGGEYAKGFTRRAIQAANRACGTPGITPHRLRGTCATLLSESGVPIQDLQRMLRHKDAKTTMAYLEVDLARVAKGQEAVAERMGLWRKKGEDE